MPTGESLTRRRFLASVSLLVPMSALAACRPAGPAAGSGAVAGPAGPARAAHTWWAEADGRITVFATGPAGEKVPLCWFNDVGGRLWCALDGKRGPDELARAVARDLGFDVEPADIEDATMFVVELARYGLIEGETHFALSRTEVAGTV